MYMMVEVSDKVEYTQLVDCATGAEALQEYADSEQYEVVDSDDYVAHVMRRLYRNTRDGYDLQYDETPDTDEYATRSMPLYVAAVKVTPEHWLMLTGNHPVDVYDYWLDTVYETAEQLIKKNLWLSV